MQIIDDGKHYLVYSNGVKAFNKLPLKSNYSVEFDDSPNGVGFYLAQKPLFTKPNFKIYGSQIDMVDKVVESFENSNKSVGVILSGPKGTGKTVFSKMLSEKTHKLGMPTVLVNNNTSGVANFISQIDQSSLIMFDEFEKKFTDSLEPTLGKKENQNDLLSLFDGILGGKNIYVLTVNNLIDLSQYILNRPGRFMYSIRMQLPEPKDISDYLNDKLNKDVNNRKEQIEEIVKFGFKFPISYDILDTLVLQLNFGNDFKTILPSLNLVNLGDTEFNVEVNFEGGYTYPLGSINLDLFKETIKVDQYNIDFDFQGDCLEAKEDHLYVNGENINRLNVDGDLKDKVQQGLKPDRISSITIRPNRAEGFEFTI